MKKRHVISTKNLPLRIPFFPIAFAMFLLHYIGVPGWVLGVIGTILGIILILCISIKISEDDIDLSRRLKDGMHAQASFNDGVEKFPQKPTKKSKFQERLEKEAEKRSGDNGNRS